MMSSRALKLFLPCLGLVFAAAACAGPAAALPGDSVYQLDVSFTDQNGTRQHFPQLRGKVRIISMFYANCPYVCPLIIDTIKQTENALDEQERARLGVVLVTLDPASDTAEALKAVEGKRHLDAARWLLVRTGEGDVRKVAGVLGIQYRALENREFNHSTAIILLDADGRIRASSQRVGAPDPDFVAAVKSALATP